MKSILDIEISCFANYSTPSGPKSVNLLAWLNSTKYKKQVDLIRSLDNKKERDLLKPKLPCITPSGLFTYRDQKSLVNHSGFIQIDLDPSKKNLEIANWNELKSELCNLPQIAYLGLSASGRGYWGLIPIPPEPGTHKGYFESLYEIFLNRFGIELDDKPKNVASIRGYSYDLNAYFNHRAKPFTNLKKPVTVAKTTPEINLKPVTDGKYQWLENWIVFKVSQAMPGDRHEARLKYARLAGGCIAGGFLPPSVEESIINSYLSQYGSSDPEPVQKKEIKAIRDGVNDGMKTPAMPPPIKCLFVPFTDLKDYSNKAFKICQGDRFYFVPKSTVYEILDFGFYVTEYFLTVENKPPQYQPDAWKEFSEDAVCIHQIPEKKTLITINDDYQSEFDRIQTEIAATEKRNRDLGNKIDSVEQDVNESENTFIQAAKVVNWEWVEPGHTKEPQGKDRLHQLIYWCE